jgi:LacI family transcriptional regulator
MLSAGNHRNLIFCGPQEFQSSQLFYQGIRDAYAEKELPLHSEGVFWFKPNEKQSAKQFTKIWTERHGEIDGVICFCDSMAFGIYRAARQLGLRIPDDISVIGYDDSSFNDFSDPPLTTIHMPKDLVAQHCSQFVLDRLIRGSTEKQTFLLEPTLTERSSVARR